MNRLLHCVTPLVLWLAVSPAILRAQTDSIAKGGTLSVQLAGNVTTLLDQQDIGLTYVGTGTTKHGENFNVTGGAVNLASGSGSAQTAGSMSFTEGSSTITLNKFALLGTNPNAYITAEVAINGINQGRYPVFLLAANLYVAPLSPGAYSSGPVRFSINPAFQAEFADYIPINGLDPSSPIGTFSLSVTIKSN